MVTAVRKKISKPKVSAYDVAEHLRTPEEMAAYLDGHLASHTSTTAPDDCRDAQQPAVEVKNRRGVAKVQVHNLPEKPASHLGSSSIMELNSAYCVAE
jgi:hypothetical protein